MIEYHTFGAELLTRVLALYREAQWTAYLGDDEKLAGAFQNSLYVLGAFDGETLVGFVRCVGDGAHIIFVQDLLVAEACQRRGIGKALLQKAREAYPQVRTFTLITDALDEKANAFYRAVQMKSHEEAGVTGYLW